jgi:hypothetical protein
MKDKIMDSTRDKIYWASVIVNMDLMNTIVSVSSDRDVWRGTYEWLEFSDTSLGATSEFIT